jgi:hypothetical protein
MGDSVMLVCAVLASLAAGVLVAYGVCLAMFRVLHMGVQKTRVASAPRVSSTASVGAAGIVEG